MINLPVEGLNEESYKKIMLDFDIIRRNYLKNKFKISMLGTQSLFFSVIDFLLSPFKKNPSLSRIVNFILRKLSRYLMKKKKILISYLKFVWTSDAILQSTLPYPVRRVEYPWSIINAKLDIPMKILDIGSGVSLFPVYLAGKGHEVISIDNDEILMNRVSPELAKLAGTKIEYRLGDITKLDFEDETFDRVFCISVLEHLEEEVIDGKPVNFRKKNLDVKGIGEMLRVLKSGGLLVLTFDWSENPDDLRSYKIDDIYDRVLKKYKSFLLVDGKPKINWTELKEKHISAGKSFPPFNYLTEGWAIGVILKKKIN